MEIKSEILSFEERVMQLCEQDTRKMVLQFHDQFRSTSCPVCFSGHSTLFANKWDLQYQRCESCRLIYLSPFPEEEIRNWYFKNSAGLKYWREEMPADFVLSRETIYSDRVDYIEDMMEKSHCGKYRFLEIGAGNGELAQLLGKRELFESIVLVEPQPLELNIPKCEVMHCTFSEAGQLLQIKANVVAAFEVLEHINDPGNFIDQVYGLLDKDGVFILSTPNIESLEIELLKGHSPTLMFDHVRLFGPTSIQELFSGDKWEILDMRTPGSKDVRTLASAYFSGNLDLTDNPALKFVCEAEGSIQDAFQKYISRTLQSSHMKIAVRKR